MLTFNAVIVAGGRSSRLGGTAKAGLSNGHSTLLETTLAAVAGAASTVVVGPEELPLPGGVLQTLEEPRFAGPAAALAAGVLSLPEDAAPWTVLLSVDMPGIAPALDVLLGQAQNCDPVSGFMGTCQGIFQPLVGIYPTAALLAISQQKTKDVSVRRWLSQIPYELVELPAGSTQDVDTWEDAEKTGFRQPRW